MPNARDRRVADVNTDAALEQAGFADWQARRVREDDLPFAEAFASAGRDQAASVLGALLQFCLPPKTYGDVRRFKSGYYRVVALAWRLTPAMLEPCREDKDVARRLGISPAAFCKHLNHVDALLAGNSATKAQNVKTGRGGSSRTPLSR